MARTPFLNGATADKSTKQKHYYFFVYFAQKVKTSQAEIKKEQEKKDQ